MARRLSAPLLLCAASAVAAPALAPRVGSLLDEIERLDREIARRSAELDWVDGRIEETEARIEDNAAAVKEREAEIARRRERLRHRSRSLYRMSQVGLAGMLLGGDSLVEIRARQHYLQVLLDHDVALVGGCREAIAELGRRREELAADRKALAELRRALAEAQRAAEEQRLQKRAFLRRIVDDEQLRRRVLAESRKATSRLGGMVHDLGSEPAPAVRSFRRSRGRLPCPVDGRVRTGFGTVHDSRLEEDIRHPGYSLEAPRGAAVQAVHPGKVAYAGYFKAFGQVVILDHGEGFFTLYAHLDEPRVERGAEVDRSAVLGTVGSTGSVRGPKLYFEVRFRGRPIDPARWVRCRQ